MGSLVEHVIVNYRWIFVMFLLPISFFYDIFFYARNLLIFKLKSAPKKHFEKVGKIQAQIREWKDQGSQKRMCTARPGWQTISPQNMTYKSSMHQIDISLVDILEVDQVSGTVTCEPMVSMGQLSHTLNPLGWTIPILPELDDLTVGGLVMGTGIETSSHRHGLFQHICLSYELILSDGSVINCSEHENSDLFYAVPWSYGTLGFLASVTIKMIPAKEFIRMTYFPVGSFQEAQDKMVEEISKESSAHEFIECLVFDRNRSVVMFGEMADSAEIGADDTINKIGTWHKPWFFKHVETLVDDNVDQVVEYIPLTDYYHRHSRSIFWEIQDIIPFGNNIIFRYLFGWLIPPKVSLLKLTQGKTIKKLYEENHMIQDMLVPISDTTKCLDFFEDEVAIYPIWLCPFKLFSNPGMLKTRQANKDEMFIDIGVYGVPKKPGFNSVQTTRRVEEYVRDLEGFQMMYADSYMTKDEFESMFDLSLYHEMRAKYNCEKAFPHVYQKVNKPPGARKVTQRPLRKGHNNTKTEMKRN